MYQHMILLKFLLFPPFLRDKNLYQRDLKYCICRTLITQFLRENYPIDSVFVLLYNNSSNHSV